MGAALILVALTIGESQLISLRVANFTNKRHLSNAHPSLVFSTGCHLFTVTDIIAVLARTGHIASVGPRLGKASFPAVCHLKYKTQ